VQSDLDSATFTAYIEHTIDFVASIAPKRSVMPDRRASPSHNKREGRMEKMILEAIANKKLIEFVYHNLPRVAEPHVYGVTNGVSQLLGYQTGGQSSNGGLPDWRRFDLSQISRLAILSQSFPGRRPIPSGRHSSWDSRIAMVD